MRGLFWATDITVPEKAGFDLFGRQHLLWLAATVILCAALAFFCCRWNDPARTRCRRVVAGALLADEGFKFFLVALSGEFWPGCLPLHLCSINIFLILADAIRPNNTLRELLCAVCLPGAFFALIFPGWAYLPMMNAMNFHRFTAHMLLLLYPVLLLAGGFQLSFKRLLRALPWCVPVLVGVYFFNCAFGTNFFFLAWAGEGNPLSYLETKLGNPGYLAGIPVIAGLCWLVLYGVSRLCQKVRRKPFS